MNFPEIDDALKVCKDNIAEIKLIEPQLESYLTAYLLIFIYSKFETKLKDIIKNSFRQYTNTACVHNYLSNCSDRIIRSI